MQERKMGWRKKQICHFAPDAEMVFNDKSSFITLYMRRILLYLYTYPRKASASSYYTYRQCREVINRRSQKEEKERSWKIMLGLQERIGLYTPNYYEAGGTCNRSGEKRLFCTDPTWKMGDVFISFLYQETEIIGMWPTRIPSLSGENLPEATLYIYIPGKIKAQAALLFTPNPENVKQFCLMWNQAVMLRIKKNQTNPDFEGLEPKHEHTTIPNINSMTDWPHMRQQLNFLYTFTWYHSSCGSLSKFISQQDACHAVLSEGRPYQVLLITAT